MTDPTDVQLANFACLRILGRVDPVQRALIAEIFKDAPELRAAWLEQHRAFQAQLHAFSGRARSDAPPAPSRQSV